MLYVGTTCKTQTILGTGILGLPVELYRCGFTPFMFLFSFALIAQGLTVYVMVELMTYATHALRKRTAEQNIVEAGLLQDESSTHDYYNGKDDHKSNTSAQASGASGASVDSASTLINGPYQSCENPAALPTSTKGSADGYLHVEDADEDADSDMVVENSVSIQDQPVIVVDENRRSRTQSRITPPGTPELGEIRTGMMGADDAISLANSGRDDLVTSDSVASTVVDPEEAEMDLSKQPTHGADLHTISTLYLTPAGATAFNVFVLFHFFTILTSYGIAGPQSLSQLLGDMSPVLISIPYIIGLSLLVVLGQKLLTPVVSVLTALKGSLLVVVVAITGILAGVVGETYSNNWTYTRDPFLITTVALGGAVNVLPVYFQKVSFNARDISRFRFSVLAGLFVVWVLNFLWALFLLEIIPQHNVGGGTISLEHAREEGEIATVPLTDIIKKDHSTWTWVSIAVQIFIAVSVTVSFFALGSGLKHILDGYFSHARRTPRLRPYLRNADARHAARHLMYGISFGIVLLIACVNPGAFLKILSRWTSLALNLESGVFLALMLYNARRMNHNYNCPVNGPAVGVQTLPWYDDKWWYQIWQEFKIYGVVLYFLIAVMYDIVTLLMGED
jgi:amino acid permease